METTVSLVKMNKKIFLRNVKIVEILGLSDCGAGVDGILESDLYAGIRESGSSLAVSSRRARGFVSSSSSKKMCRSGKHRASLRWSVTRRAHHVSRHTRAPPWNVLSHLKTIIYVCCNEEESRHLFFSHTFEFQNWHCFYYCMLLDFIRIFILILTLCEVRVK